MHGSAQFYIHMLREREHCSSVCVTVSLLHTRCTVHGGGVTVSTVDDVMLTEDTVVDYENRSRNDSPV